MAFNISINSNHYSSNDRFKSSFGNSAGAMSPELANDRFEAASSSKDKKESFLSKHWGKMLIAGVGAVLTIFLLAKSRNTSTSGEVNNYIKDNNIAFFQEKFKQIFRRNFLKESSEQMLQKYKEIYQIEDKNEFINKLFEQFKKDFGYGNTAVKLNISKGLPQKSKEGIVLADYRLNNINVNEGLTREQYYNSLSHELTHMRQEEYMFRCDTEKWKQMRIGTIKRFLENDKEGQAAMKMIIKPDGFVERLCEASLKDISDNFGHLPKFKKGSLEYEQAEKYFEAYSKYDLIKDHNEYKNNYLEQEAHKFGGMMQEVANYIKNM